MSGPDAAIFGAALDAGNLHFQMSDNLMGEGAAEKFDRFSRDLSELVSVRYGGSLKAEPRKNARSPAIAGCRSTRPSATQRCDATRQPPMRRRNACRLVICSVGLLRRTSPSVALSPP